MSPEQREKVQKVYAGGHLQEHFKGIDELQAAVRALYGDLIAAECRIESRDADMKALRTRARQALDDVAAAANGAERKWRLHAEAFA